MKHFVSRSGLIFPDIGVFDRLKFNPKKVSMAYTNTDPSSKMGDIETVTLLIEISTFFESGGVVIVRWWEVDRLGIFEENGRERRNVGESERGEKWRRRWEREGWPKVLKAVSGGEKMVRVVVVEVEVVVAEGSARVGAMS